MTLADLLREAMARGASDLHLVVGSAPQVRVDGVLHQLARPVLSADAVADLVQSALTDTQKRTLGDTWELDLAFGLDDLGRVRCNVFKQKGSFAAVYRMIPAKIPTLDELDLPPVIADLADRPRGLVLVTGPTGSGKSTTLAAMLDRINTTRAGHVLTIEDPVEYVHDHKLGLVNQRELHTDTQSLALALRAALREDPDVVLIGEMRDSETIATALKLAETGHLTMATLHTSSAAQTITRIVDAFPAHQQAQIRTQLAFVLEGVVSQVLVAATPPPGRVAALEILVATPAIRNLIRDDKIHQIYGVMQTGQERFGMQTMNQALARLVERRRVTREAAFAVSSNRDELAMLVERGVSEMRSR